MLVRCQCQGFGGLLLLQAQQFALVLPMHDRGADMTAKVSPSLVNIGHVYSETTEAISLKMNKNWWFWFRLRNKFHSVSKRN